MSLTPPKLKSIILADDDPDDQDLFSEALKNTQCAHNLASVKNGAELMSILEHFIPDLVFLDLDMPVKNGLQCIAEIRARPQLGALPLVVFSSTSKPSNITAAYDVGAHLYFVKPAGFTLLVKALQKILEMNWAEPIAVRNQFFRNGRFHPFIPE